MSGRVIFLALLIAFLGCSNDDPDMESNNDYILFGHFYGFCVGESCIEIFKIENGKLYEDTLDLYPLYDAPYEGKYIELSSGLYDLVSDIESLIPSELLNISNTTIGCPDCTDGGGVFIQIGRSDEIRYWLIDQFEGNVPEEIQPFVTVVNNRIALLQ